MRCRFKIALEQLTFSETICR